MKEELKVIAGSPQEGGVVRPTEVAGRGRVHPTRNNLHWGTSGLEVLGGKSERLHQIVRWFTATQALYHDLLRRLLDQGQLQLLSTAPREPAVVATK